MEFYTEELILVIFGDHYYFQINPGKCLKNYGMKDHVNDSIAPDNWNANPYPNINSTLIIPKPGT